MGIFMFADTHNHTCHFSPDAEMTIDELISSAADRKIGIVGITEHYEYDNPDPTDIIGTFDLEEYGKAFEEWKKKAGDIILLKGIEFGYQTHTAEIIDKISSENSFDQVILSNHLFRGLDVYFSKECYLVDRITRHKEYIGKMAEMADKCRNYDIIGHYDYVNRFNPVKEETVFYEDCKKEFDDLFEVMISKEKALEINTRSIESQIRRFSPYIMPDKAVLKRYLDMGGKLISLGSDSHSSETLGIHFRKTCEYLKMNGVNEVVYFKDRKPLLLTI